MRENILNPFVRATLKFQNFNKIKYKGSEIVRIISLMKQRILNVTNIQLTNTYINF